MVMEAILCGSETNLKKVLAWQQIGQNQVELGVALQYQFVRGQKTMYMYV